MRKYLFLLGGTLLQSLSILSFPLSAMSSQLPQDSTEQKMQSAAVVKSMTAHAQTLDVASRVVSLRWIGKASSFGEDLVDGLENDVTHQETLATEFENRDNVLRDRHLTSPVLKSLGLPSIHDLSTAFFLPQQTDAPSVAFQSEDLDEFKHLTDQQGYLQDLQQKSTTQSDVNPIPNASIPESQLLQANDFVPTGDRTIINSASEENPSLSKQTEVAPGGGEHWLDDPTSAWW